MESPSKVQHVTKVSSDKLLRKFAEMCSDSDTDEPAPSPLKSSSKRRILEKKKKKTTTGNNELEDEISPSKENNNINLISNYSSGSYRKVERKSLLPNKRSGNKRSSRNLLRQFGDSRSKFRSCKHRSVFGAFEKTWSKTIREASKVFMVKHYNRHRILGNDIG